MWPSIKHWRDWAMHNLWSLTRVGPQPQALHYSFEKAGLTLHDQPIPWNAEVVQVETLIGKTPVARRKQDYSIRVPGRDPIPADSLRQGQANEQWSRLFFRFPTPAHTTAAEIFYRNHRLGQLTLPILSRDEFVQQLRLQLPTLFVRLGEHNVPCQTFVSTQCKGMMAAALLVSPTSSLVPLMDLGLNVEFRSERGAAHTVPVKLSSSQLADRQALLSVVPRRFPKRIGAWTATWMIGDRVLATQRIRAISQRQFQRSLRVSDTRFVVQHDGDQVNLSRQVPPLEQVERLGPCFLVSSKEPGMAGVCSVQVRVQVSGANQPPTLPAQDILITDGPTLVAPGTLDAADIEQVTAFELLLKNQLLGHLPLSPVPVAGFTAEGGFKPPVDYTWSLAADEELNERLTRLLEGGGKG